MPETCHEPSNLYLVIMAELNHDHFMNLALKEAARAYEEGEVPIGAIIVMNEKIIARGYNQVEKLTDPTAHAEMIALTSAFNYLGAKYLPEASLYVTIEPCIMCAGALYWSKIGTVVYGSPDIKNGYNKWLNSSSMYDSKNKSLHPKTMILSGIKEKECVTLMQNFFKERR